jgi:hypothetical protein
MKKRFLIALLLVGGCASTPRPHPRVGPAPAPAALLESLQARHRALRTLEIETRTTTWFGGDRLRGTVLMMVAREGRLRFEASVPVQGAVASLVVDNGQFALLDLEAKVFRRGPACPENVAALVRIPLMPQEIAAILLGDAPLGADARATTVEWDPIRGAEILTIESAPAPAGAASAEATPRLWVFMRRGSSGYEVIGLEGESPNRPGRWRVSYEDLSPAGPVAIPQLIRFAEPGRSFDEGVEIKVRERLAVNQTLDPEAFTIVPPPGYPIQQQPCPARR